MQWFIVILAGALIFFIAGPHWLVTVLAWAAIIFFVREIAEWAAGVKRYPWGEIKHVDPDDLAPRERSDQDQPE